MVQAVSKDESLAQAAAERELTVSFNADVSDGLPWKFVPCQRSVTLRAGQSTLVFYNAQNQGDKSITGVLLWACLEPDSVQALRPCMRC